MVKGASTALGIRAILVDLGIERGIRLNSDASAAIGIAMGRGPRKSETHRGEPIAASRKGQEWGCGSPKGWGRAEFGGCPHQTD